ncbi:hypothetical protein [Rubinisphaera sp.]|nr:hypothetical protein [Rubinisphaera sp.]
MARFAQQSYTPVLVSERLFAFVPLNAGIVSLSSTSNRFSSLRI